MAPANNPDPRTSCCWFLGSNVVVGDWDGAAELTQGSSTEEPQWKEGYSQEVVLVDERRFLISEALEYVLIVGVGAVEGERKVVVRDGKSAIEISDEVMAVWREYERRGEQRTLVEEFEEEENSRWEREAERWLTQIRLL